MMPESSILIQYIETNLESGLHTKDLSRVGYMSHAKLYREFYSLTGHSVNEYIRKRRLSNALALIKTSDFSWADIAHQCGYSSQQALCRAVKNALNMTPTMYKNSDMYYFFPPFKGQPLHSITVTNENLPQMRCLRFYHTSLNGIEDRAIEALLSCMPDYNGRLFGKNGKQRGTYFCYELYLSGSLPDDWRLRSYGFEAAHHSVEVHGLFATLTVRNAEHEINAAWNYLYHTWIQSSMFEYTAEPYYEEYCLKNKKAVKLRLYLPIRKRSENTKITLVSDPELHFIVSRAEGYDAERIASKTVINYLSDQYPYLVKTAREFYLQKDGSSYTCGVRVAIDPPWINDPCIESIAAEKGDYLVLESSMMGDYDRYAEWLLTFADNNGMTAKDDALFAVYDAKNSFDTPVLRMYCPVKLIQNDNTA